MKKIIAIILSAVLVLSICVIGVVVTQAEIVESGECGDGISYTLDDNGTLTISGEGEIDYSFVDSEFVEYILKVVIQPGITAIGDESFFGLLITSVSLPNTLEAIGASAFECCGDLGSVVIPDSVVEIGDCAFKDTGLTELRIGKGLESIPESAFRTPTLSTVTVDEDNPVYDSRNNCNAIIETDTNTLIKGCKNTTIPNTVTCIGESAFEECDRLTSITIPDSVTFIGNSAFYGCTGLTSVTIPDSVTEIDDMAFYQTSLESVIIPGSVTSIGSGAFEECSSLQEVVIQDGVQSIGARAFLYCDVLETLIIPASVTNIGKGAIRNTSNPTVFTYSNATEVINYCSTQKVTCITMDGKCGDNVDYTISPDGVLVISGTGDMYDFDISNNKSPFYMKASIKKVIIEEGVTSVGDNAFCFCSGIASVSIPDTVTEIGSAAFWQCNSLSELDLGNGVVSIDTNAFRECTSLTELVLPNSVTTIGKQAFSGCTGITSLHLSDNLESIGESAFNGCTGLTSVTIPDSVTVIDDWAFAGCTNLSDVSVSKSIKKIGNGAFQNSTIAEGRFNIQYTSPSPLRYGWLCQDPGTSPDGHYILFKNGTLLLINEGINPDYADTVSWNTRTEWVGYTDAWGELEVPWIQYKDRIAKIVIGEKVTDTTGYKGTQFNDFPVLEEVYLPDDLKYLGKNTFLNLPSLKTIFVSKSVREIDCAQDLFIKNCSNVESIIVDPENPMYDSRENCNAIIYTSSNALLCGCKNTTIPLSVNYLKDFSLYGFNIQDILVPSTVTTLEHNSLLNNDDICVYTYPRAAKVIDYCEENNVNYRLIESPYIEDSGDSSNNTKVTLTNEAPTFRVTVPTVLPVAVDSNNIVTVADNAAIVNYSNGAVDVTNAVLNTSTWSVVSFDSDFTKKPVNTKEYGFKINNDDAADGIDTAIFDTIDGQSSLPFTYNANVAIQSAPYDGVDIGNIVFTVAWHK